MKKPVRRGRRILKISLYFLLVCAALGGYGYWAINRPLPPLKPQLASSQIVLTAPAGTLTWPTAGQAAVGIVDSDILETHGVQAPVPTASTAKIITALTVLRDKPLTVGQQGPLITLSASDVALYDTYNAADGSVVKVVAGEQISEYQMLEAMMLPSANNMADSLATWAFGSLDAYANAANAFVLSIGLQSTHVGTDASGFDPSTVSTAHDLVKLGELAMQNPVLAQIVGQTSASGLPIVDTVKNVNFLLGNSGIIGVKTGNSDQAGGVFVSAAKVTVNSQPTTIVTALTGAPSLFAAMQGSLPLIQSAQTNFKPVTVVQAGDIIGSYHLPWGGSISAAASKDLKLSAWGGSNVTATVSLKPVSATSAAGPTAGQVQTDNSHVNAKLQQRSTKPTIKWRLLHPLNR